MIAPLQLYFSWKAAVGNMQVSNRPGHRLSEACENFSNELSVCADREREEGVPLLAFPLLTAAALAVRHHILVL